MDAKFYCFSFKCTCNTCALHVRALQLPTHYQTCLQKTTLHNKAVELYQLKLAKSVTMQLGHKNTILLPPYLCLNSHIPGELGFAGSQPVSFVHSSEQNLREQVGRIYSYMPNIPPDTQLFRSIKVNTNH